MENILNRIFILLLGSCPRGDLGSWWVKNLDMGVCDGAPLTAHSSSSLLLYVLYGILPLPISTLYIELLHLIAAKLAILSKSFPGPPHMPFAVGPYEPIFFYDYVKH